jgi:alkylated DNA repair dioxygenase AlkB
LNTEGLIYQPNFVAENDRKKLHDWLAGQQPLWENRHHSERQAREGQKRRRLLRPVIWLGGWQFACLNYYRTGHERHRVVEAEPFPPVLRRLTDELEEIARKSFDPEHIPDDWHLNTCLINFYGMTRRDETWYDTARVGSHRDHEPGPVGSLSLGSLARFEFTTGRRQGNDTIVERELEDGSMLLFGTPRFKKKLHHRVTSVASQRGDEFDTEIRDFRLRRVNFTLRYVPPQFIHPYRQLPTAVRTKIEAYIRTLAERSPFFARALRRAESEDSQ